MARLANAVLDASLAHLVTNVNAIHLVDGFDPDVDDRTWVLANSLAGAAIVPGDWAGPADGPVDGRIVTLASKSTTADSSFGAGAGNLGFVLISGTEWLYYVDETSERELVAAEALDFPSVPVRMRDPA